MSVLAGAVWLSGCVRLGYNPITEPPGDSSADVNRLDGGQLPDAAPSDQRTETPLPESDGPGRDVALVDVVLTDLVAPEADVWDLDLVQKDTGVGPCAGGASLAGQSGQMAVCQGTPVVQCQAGQYCNAQAGYSVCTASQYKQQFATKPPSSSFVTAWIASCLHGDTPGVNAHAPSDLACPLCIQKMVAPGFQYQWTCSGGTSQSSSLDYVGVATSSTCYRLGVNSSINAAFWKGFLSKNLLGKVVCCK